MNGWKIAVRCIGVSFRLVLLLFVVVVLMFEFFVSLFVCVKKKDSLYLFHNGQDLTHILHTCFYTIYTYTYTTVDTTLVYCLAPGYACVPGSRYFW